MVVLFLTLGCAQPDIEQVTPVGEGPSTTAGTQDTDTLEAVGINYHRDVAPILERNCTRCHVTGGLGTGDFTDFGTAAAMAELMLVDIDLGLMPPPSSDPDCRDYLGSEYIRIDPADRDVIAAWIDGGLLEGDPAGVTPEEGPADQLEDPDLIVQLDEPYAPAFSKDGNEYRCFVVQDVPDDDYFITAMHPVIGNWEMVHHLVLHSVDPAKLSAATTDPSGFDCYGGEQYGITKAQLGVWAPGMLPFEMPEGVGIQMSGADPLLLEFHYYDPGTLEPGASDRSGYALRIAETVEIPAVAGGWSLSGFTVPAGVEAWSMSGSASVGWGQDLTLYAMWPHMHVLGSGFAMDSTDFEGQSDCLVQSDQYDFENQYQYIYREPYISRQGSTLSYTCTWNNTASNRYQLYEPPIDIPAGLNTNEEMCVFFALYSVGAPEPFVRVGDVAAGELSLLRSTADLDLEGSAIAALNHGGDSIQVDAVDFAGVATPGIPYIYNPPDFDADAATMNPIETVAYSGVYSDIGDVLRIPLTVPAGTDYRLQLLFFEPYYTTQGYRKLDITVDGERVVHDLDASTSSQTAGIVYSLEGTATGDQLTVVVQGAESGDGYGILSGLSLELGP